MQAPCIDLGRASLGLLACVLLGGCAHDSDQLTDLAITAAPQIDPLAPTVDQSVLVTAIIRNLDGNYAPRALLLVRVDGIDVARERLDAIAPQGSLTFTTSVRFTTAGGHSLALVIDPDEEFDDLDRSNNTQIVALIVSLPVSG